MLQSGSNLSSSSHHESVVATTVKAKRLFAKLAKECAPIAILLLARLRLWSVASGP